jgi:hypothetical protein
VQEQVRELTATLSYDRAGLGSSGGAGPWSLEAWVADLERRSAQQAMWESRQMAAVCSRKSSRTWWQTGSSR